MQCDADDELLGIFRDLKKGKKNKNAPGTLPFIDKLMTAFRNKPQT